MERTFRASGHCLGDVTVELRVAGGNLRDGRKFAGDLQALKTFVDCGENSTGLGEKALSLLCPAGMSAKVGREIIAQFGQPFQVFPNDDVFSFDEMERLRGPKEAGSLANFVQGFG